MVKQTSMKIKFPDHIAQYPGPLRLETGAVQFGEDWPGVFIRGDDAIGMARDIRAARQGILDGRLPANQRIGRLEKLLDLLESCSLERDWG
jgi:hypothetical protein